MLEVEHCGVVKIKLEGRNTLWMSEADRGHWRRPGGRRI